MPTDPGLREFVLVTIRYVPKVASRKHEDRLHTVGDDYESALGGLTRGTATVAFSTG